MATLPSIAPDAFETLEINAISAVLTADLSAAITAASGTPPSGASLTALVAALVVDVTGALATARQQASKSNRGFNYNIVPGVA
jgi:hypothetical protein